MDNAREKLLDLLVQGREKANKLCGEQDECEKCPYQAPKGCSWGVIADYLIAKGVTLNVTDINVGDKVYALYSVEGYKTRTGSTRKRNWQIDTRKNLMMQKKYGKIEVREKKCTKTDMHRIGVTVFKTKEEAERVIAND